MSTKTPSQYKGIWEHEHRLLGDKSALFHIVATPTTGVRALGRLKTAEYLFLGSYTVEGVKGLLKEGGSSRRSHFRKIVGHVGGNVEAFHFAFGGDDVYSIVDLRDNVSTVALSMALAAGGGFRPSTIGLLTPEEVDQATRKAASVGYRPPGQ